MTEFCGGNVWPEITKACRSAGPRRAAIAYVGAAAPELLPLRRGDVLYVNASDAALLAHATHPGALATFLTRGVAVWSCPQLHAKVLATATTTVIGSANASGNSTTLDEAVVVSTSVGLRRQALAFMDDLDHVVEVTEAFIEAAWGTWNRGRGGGRPGTDGGVQDRPFLPAPPYRVHVAADVRETKWDDVDQGVYEDARRRLRRAAGRASRYTLWSLTLGPSVTPYKVGDVVIVIDGADDDRQVWAPAVVFSPALKVGRRRYVMQLLRYDNELPELELSAVEGAWKRARRPGRFDRTRWLRDPSERQVVLAMWGLSED